MPDALLDATGTGPPGVQDPAIKETGKGPVTLVLGPDPGHQAYLVHHHEAGISQTAHHAQGATLWPRPGADTRYPRLGAEEPGMPQPTKPHMRVLLFPVSAEIQLVNHLKRVDAANTKCLCNIWNMAICSLSLWFGNFSRNNDTVLRINIGMRQ